jgi:hypothetical protein
MVFIRLEMLFWQRSYTLAGIEEENIDYAASI